MVERLQHCRLPRSKAIYFPIAAVVLVFVSMLVLTVLHP